MSRAINGSVKEAIKNGNHEHVFHEMGAALDQRLDKLLEIEILSESHATDAQAVFVQEDACIGIPKFRLLQAFIVARQILLSEGDGRDPRDHRVLQATAVILLMDPEHVTAANRRKKALVLATDETLRDEAYFIDSLLTSRLTRHAKSPTLWSHRGWLTGRMGWPHGLPALRDVVLVAADRHPRNYHAWGFARHLLAAGGAAARRRALEEVAPWVYAHHDDVSGWSFLVFFLDVFPEHAAATVGETLRLASGFRWRNESVWYFLRTMARKMPDVREDVLSTRLALLKGDEDDVALHRALRWIES